MLERQGDRRAHFLLRWFLMSGPELECHERTARNRLNRFRLGRVQVRYKAQLARGAQPASVVATLAIGKLGST